MAFLAWMEVLFFFYDITSKIGFNTTFEIGSPLIFQTLLSFSVLNSTDIAPLERICELADKHSALVLVDECHGSGFLGKKGRGASELCGVLDRVDIINSTLGKALGGAIGGFTTSHDYIVETLRNKARPYLFSNSLPPSVIGSSIKVFDMLSSDSSQRDALQKNTEYFRNEIKKSGFTVSGHQNSPIVKQESFAIESHFL